MKHLAGLAITVCCLVGSAAAVEYEGLLFPITQVVLSTLSSGVVTVLPCREGQKVASGKVLLAMDARKDSLNLILAQRKLERSQIEKTNEVETAVDVQLKEIACAEKNVTAPFGATILRVMAKPGEYYTAGSKVIELADLSRLITEIHVTADDLRRLQNVKTPVTVERASQQCKGDVHSFNPLAEPGVELFLVKISFQNKYNWAAGTSAKVRF
jgi:multidrug efflux pump subunit AcrA (membrane-fusion protein)